MAKTLLRSGNLDDFQAVGGGGQAVFESALQIREALRLRKQQAIVDCLAIPRSTTAAIALTGTPRLREPSPAGRRRMKMIVIAPYAIWKTRSPAWSR